MRKFNSLIVCLIILLATGCNHPKKDVLIRDAYIRGSISCDDTYMSFDDIIQVEDGSYTFSIRRDKLCITVPFKKISAFPEGITIDKINEVYLVPEDADEDYIETESGDIVALKLTDPDDLEKLILNQKTGKTTDLTFKFALLGENTILEEINSFSIELDVDFKPEENKNHSSCTYGEFLDEYTEYIKDIKRVAEKAMKGDLSAASEYRELLLKASDLSDKLTDLEDDMTADDLKKLQKLNNELLDMADMSFSNSGSNEDTGSLFDFF